MAFQDLVILILKSFCRTIRKYYHCWRILLASDFYIKFLYDIKSPDVHEIFGTNGNTKLNINISSYNYAICKSRKILQLVRRKLGIPGIVVGVSVNGQTVWIEGMGYADVENHVSCSVNTVMRIGSISKSITMASVAKLWEHGKLDIDKPVQYYVPYFPYKTYNGEPVNITCRQLVSHLGGIRHYDRKLNERIFQKIGKDTDEKSNKTESIAHECFNTKHYKDVASSLNIFKDDPLVANPGSKYSYSTYGWTLISAIVEAVSKESFSTHITKLFKFLGMSSTYLDVHDVLIYHRSRNYIRDNKEKLINARFVDNSYKWAGGGFLSTVPDLLRFGNIMLYSFQAKPIVEVKGNDKNIKNFAKTMPIYSSQEMNHCVSKERILDGYLEAETVKAMWTSVTNAKEPKYGMGWSIIAGKSKLLPFTTEKFGVYHTGGAVGASSVILILPTKTMDCEMKELTEIPSPKGILISILANLGGISLLEIALLISEYFDYQLQEF